MGTPLAGVLESVAAAVSQSGQAQARRSTAMAGPRSTARLLAALPLAAPLMGAAVGADPWKVLGDGGTGTLVAGCGVVLMLAGHVWSARLLAAAQAEQARVDEVLVLELAQAALSAGASVPFALKALGEAVDEPGLVVVSRALLLGAQWHEAWDLAGPGRTGTKGGQGLPTRHLERCLRPAWQVGASPTPLLARAAESLRREQAASAEAGAERLAVRLVLPLGLCHLPAFVLLGVVPVVLDVGGQVLRQG